MVTEERVYNLKGDTLSLTESQNAKYFMQSFPEPALLFEPSLFLSFLISLYSYLSELQPGCHTTAEDVHQEF